MARAMAMAPPCSGATWIYPARSALPPHVALNVLTNDFNKAARVALDFPAVVA